jgi:hypothetical protein
MRPRLDAALLAEQATLEAALRIFAESPVLDKPSIDELCDQIEARLSVIASLLELGPHVLNRPPWGMRDAVQWRPMVPPYPASDADLPF